MSQSSIQRSTQADEVDDILDNFYFTVEDVGDNLAEQEDVGFYNLYDQRTPQAYSKSPSFAITSPYIVESLSDVPIDQDVLAKKLRVYLESRSNSAFGPKYGSRDCADFETKELSCAAGDSGVYGNEKELDTSYQKN